MQELSNIFKDLGCIQMQEALRLVLETLLCFLSEEGRKITTLCVLLKVPNTIVVLMCILDSNERSLLVSAHIHTK